MTSSPLPPQHYPTDVPTLLLTLITSCTSHTPSLRPTTFSHIMKELEEISAMVITETAFDVTATNTFDVTATNMSGRYIAGLTTNVASDNTTSLNTLTPLWTRTETTDPAVPNVTTLTSVSSTTTRLNSSYSLTSTSLHAIPEKPTPPLPSVPTSPDTNDDLTKRRKKHLCIALLITILIVVITVSAVLAVVLSKKSDSSASSNPGLSNPNPNTPVQTITVDEGTADTVSIYRIKGEAGKCLTMPRNGNALETCDGGRDDQKFKLTSTTVPLTPGFVKSVNGILQSPTSGKCLGLSKSVFTVNVPVGMNWTVSDGNCDGSEFQLGGPLGIVKTLVVTPSFELILSADDGMLR
ncbi:hypothetical protein BC829DRAFT_229741 [Chytridium lagenaria]|nr:hypothetical protein BC829DRAFT_229741 [Chytridium lagenaria]